jgi:hypothetical protein
MARFDIMSALADGLERDAGTIAGQIGLAVTTVRQNLGRCVNAGLVRRSSARGEGGFTFALTQKGADYLNATTGAAATAPAPTNGFTRAPAAPPTSLSALAAQHQARGDGDSLQVFRIVDGKPGELVSRAPAEHLLAVGGNFETFALRRIAPFFGGGEFLVRGLDGTTGQVIIESRVRLGGEPRTPAPAPTPAPSSSSSALTGDFWAQYELDGSSCAWCARRLAVAHKAGVLIFQVSHPLAAKASCGMCSRYYAVVR